ncbi:phage tail tape measure protein [Leuconostoc gasicomitatum]|uniref:phage tail tape measure protein n=1 Tax=Leuconostoc gasicomitatum TaxID=115778 RepID=UPI001CC45590|nr:phage tail tape measure protein [Leuconostoc gasicomitatum]MBZ5980377.1 phage tail tape measure protein [Leuconostoc gasicomitatum]
MANYNGGNVTAHIGADISDYQSAMKNVAGATQSALSSANQAFSSIGKTLAITGAAITAVGIKSLTGFGSFQASLNKAAVIAGGTSKDIQGLSDVANKMGADLPLSAKDAADAMVAMARDGASIGTIKKEFPAIAQAATAAGADLQTTASVVQQSMNIWGDSLKSPQQSAAILTQTANLSNASIEDMQQALATIGGTANNAGIDMQTVSTALGLLTNRGFSAAQASQDLNHALLLMQAPSKKGAEMAASLGVSFSDAQGNMKPLPQILNEIGDATASMTSSEKAAALKTMFGSAGMAAILPLMKSVKDTTDNTTTSWSAFTGEMNKASSSTQVATKFLASQASEMQKNVGSKIEQVGGNWESLRNSSMAGSSGVMGSIADMISSTLQWATTSNSAIGSGIRTFLGLTPIIGAATLATGSFLTAATKIGGVMRTLGTAMRAMLISPLGIAVIAITALVAAFAIAYNKSEQFRNTVNQLAGTFSKALAPAIDFAKKSFGLFLQGTASAFQGIIQQVANLGTSIAKSINFSSIGSSLIGFISQVMNVMTIARNAVADFIKGFIKANAVQSVWLALVSTFNLLKDVIGTVIISSSKLLSSFSQVGSSESAFETLGAIIGSLVTVISNAVYAVTRFIDSLTKIEGFNDVFTSVVVAVGSVVIAFKVVSLAVKTGQVAMTMFSNAIKIGQGVMAAFNVVMSANPIVLLVIAITAVVVALAYFFTQTKTGQEIWSNFVKFLSGVWGGIKQGVIGAGKAVSDAWSSSKKSVENAWSGTKTFFSNLWTNVSKGTDIFVQANQKAGSDSVNALKSGWNSVATFFSNVWDSVIQTLQPVFDLIIQGWNAVVTNLSTIWNGLVSIATGVWNLLKDVIMGPILLLLDLIIGDFTNLGIDAQNIWTNIVTSLGQIWNGIVMIATTIFGIIANTINVIWTTISDFAVSIWNSVVSTVVGIWNSFTTAATKFATDLWTSIVNVWNAIPGFLSGLWNRAVSTVTGIWNVFVNSAVSFGNRLWNGIKNIWNAIPGWVSSLWNGVRNVISSVWNAIASTVSSLARSAWNGVVGAWSGAIGWVSGIWNGVKSAIYAAMNFDLWGAGQAIMNSFLNGLRSVWGAITSFVGGIASWIRAHKGPISYDRKLLIPAGQAIMSGFGSSLNANFETVKKSVSSYAGQIADEFGQQQYTSSAQLTTSSTGVAGQINGGLSALSDKVAEQQTQSPVFQVFNEIVGDKITTTVNSKNARRQSTVQIMGGGA